MSKISEAAKREACRLITEYVQREGYDLTYTPANMGDCFTALPLARVLQEHSDVAKALDDEFVVRAFHKTSWQRKALATLILPDEPADPVEEGLAIREEVSARIHAAIDAIRRKDQG